MSTPIGQLIVRIGADIDEAVGGLRRFGRALDQAGQQWEQLGNRLSLRLTAPLLAVGTAATKATADWETAMTGVAKTVDAPAEQLERLAQIFVGMSERIPVTAIELAKLGEEAGQLGIHLQNIPAFVETVAALRVATNLGEEAGTSLARLANIMGTAQTEFGRMGSVIVDLGNNLATTEAEIVDMGLRIAGAGKTIGLTEAQVLGFAGALSSVGVRSEAGGTAISRVMVDIAQAVDTGSDKLQVFARVAGMSVDDFSERFRTDAAGAIQAFIAGLGRLDAQGESTFAVLEELSLADVRVRDVLLRAAGAGDLLTRSLEIGSRAWEENTALAAEADQFYDRLAATFTRLWSKAKNITAEFGNALRPAIERVTEAGDKMLNIARGLVRQFAALSAETRVQIALWAGIAAAIGPVLVGLGGFVTALGFVASSAAQVVAVLGGLRAMFARVLAVMGGAALVKVGVVLGGVALAVAAIKNNWLGMGTAAAAAWRTLLDVVPRVLSAVGGAFKPWLNILIASFHSLGSVAAIIFDEFIKAPAIAAFQAIRDWARPVLSAVAKGFELLGRLGEGAAKAIREAFAEAGEGADEEGATLGQRIAATIAENFGRDYVGEFVGFVMEGINRARDLVARAIERLREMSGGGAAIAELEQAQIALDGVGETVDEAGSGLDNTNKRMSMLASSVENVASAFTDALGGAISDVGQAFRSFVSFAIRELLSLAARFAVFKIALGIAGGPAGLAGFFGSSFLGFSIPGRAMGGPVVSGQPYVVGERGPELFVPRSSGTVVPNHAMQQPVVFNFDASKLPRPTDPRQAARDADWLHFLSDSIREWEASGGRMGGR